MAKTGRDIHIPVRMMNNVKLPHPFYFMLHPMDKPRTNKIKDKKTKNHLYPQRHIEKIQNTALM